MVLPSGRDQIRKGAGDVFQNNRQQQNAGKKESQIAKQEEERRIREEFPGISDEKISTVMKAIYNGSNDWFSTALLGIVEEFAELFYAHWIDAEEVFEDPEIAPHRSEFVERVRRQHAREGTTSPL